MSDLVAADELRLLIERIENLEADRRGVMEDIRNVFSEAKSRGFDPKIMRQIIKLRAIESHERQEWEAVLDTYIAAEPIGRLVVTIALRNAYRKR